MLDTVAGVVAGFSFIDSEHSKEARIHKPVPAYTSKGTSAVKSFAKKGLPECLCLHLRQTTKQLEVTSVWGTSAANTAKSVLRGRRKLHVYSHAYLHLRQTAIQNFKSHLSGVHPRPTLQRLCFGVVENGMYTRMQIRNFMYKGRGPSAQILFLCTPSPLALFIRWILRHFQVLPS